MKIIIRNIIFYVIGIGFLVLTKLKSFLHGYSTPKPFNNLEIAKCIDYDLNIVDEWISYLNAYTNSNNYLIGKTVLELGPGSDLGVGIYLLFKGCSSYYACDVNNLISSTPDIFYDQLFNRLSTLYSQARIEHIKDQFKEYKAGNPSQINFVLSREFNLYSAFKYNKIDIVFSQAAFEHFDDVNETIFQLSKICKPGAVLISQIDLKTHSRWIRDVDPVNIYRYSPGLYNLFYYRGIPNRFRPYQYQKILENNGWIDVRIVPQKAIEKDRIRYRSLSQEFRDIKNQMEYLSILLYARKG